MITALKTLNLPMMGVQPTSSSSSRPSLRFGSLKALACFDIDDTLLLREPHTDQSNIEGVAQRLKCVPGQVGLMLNTVRNLQLIKQLQTDLAPLTVQSLSLNKGQEIYRNPSGAPFAEWLDRLTPQDADPVWAAHIKDTVGWSIDRLKERVRATFLANGFVPEHPASTPNPSWREQLIYHYEDKAGNRYMLDLRPEMSSSYRFVVLTPHSVLTPQQSDFVHTLHTRVVEGLKSKDKLNVHCNEYVRRDDSYAEGSAIVLVKSVTPADVSKKSSLTHLLRHGLNAQALVTAGDSAQDDGPMLEPRSYWAKGYRRNFPIQVGGDPQLTARLAPHPRFEQVEPGHLLDGLDRQLAKLKI